MVGIFANVFTNNDTYRYLDPVRSNTRQSFSRNRAIADKFLFRLAAYEDRLDKALHSGSHSEQRHRKFFVFFVGKYEWA